MDENRTVATNDRARVRAMAHPLRLRLLELLDERDLTATECSRLTGESVASCAFHLSSLATHGFVEPAPRRGREKPWRSVARHRSLSVDPADPESAREVARLAGMVVEREAARFAAWTATVDDEPSEWLLASTVSTSSFWATSEELAALSAEVAHLTDRFRGRWQDPGERPPGARPATFFGVVNPDRR
ncbi:ArsR family transcriptional regulator [Actinotalea fermentans]|nr:ArsR family transcriptional regulator [Actinotalea fermentans]KGM16298.1 hypothetical protein N867_01685 [Actinotalea fermentans ATCC 43279 = JCM 9966 = DSM 3133]